MDLQDFYAYRNDGRVLESLVSLSYRSGDLRGYLHDVAHGVSCLLHSDWSIVTISQGEMGHVIANSFEQTAIGQPVCEHQTLENQIRQTGRSLIIENVEQIENGATAGMLHCCPPEDYRCYIGVPLRTAQGEISGTICSFFREPRQFTEAEIHTVEVFAEQAAIAIDNYRLYQQQKRFNAQLAQEIEDRAQELRMAQARLVEQERLAAIGELAAMIVHEVRNPLTTIVMGLKHAASRLSETASYERLQLSLSEADRLQKLLNEILLYAKPQVLQLSRINIGEFLNGVLKQVLEMPEASERHLDLINTVPSLEILGDRDKLKQVFINLFRNAYEAIAPGERVRCEISRWADSEAVNIRVHNYGTPIPEAILPKLTQPFCSTKPNGTGLGLAIVKRIVSDHGGELRIQSVAATGTTVDVQLPIAKL
ncbi:GAF domain-containing sensor histidine kinase [Thermoleptolyngbya sp. M55_K2018_002]|uniref:GAF domain-containing sensor histidine kinase n=1 Tax=Thermoleptolyngbya sp. M55_K2018_002 TaxID=2747808 RepID=UPI0019FB3ACC|nr:GAF domain-containing sensor histidine kinase [Thermoleptolyngbya sp. M55_K2018_002]HIK41990.1 GAF domain-containing protein [Thermoleptolyngbya sp. M55_K2018_002]